MEIFYMLFSDYWPVAIGIIAALIFSFVTSLEVDATFKKHNADYVDSKIPACDAARQILDMNGLDLAIQENLCRKSVQPSLKGRFCQMLIELHWSSR